MALNDRQICFIDEYLKDLSGTGAALRAGYSEKTAAQIASENLRKPEIRQKIRRAMKRRSERTAITADRVLHEYAKIAFSDLRNLATWGPDGLELRESSELTAEDAATVAEITQTVTKVGGRIRLKLWDKMNALDKICRNLGMYEPTPSDDPDAFARRVRLLIQQGNERTGGTPDDDQED